MSLKEKELIIKTNVPYFTLNSLDVVYISEKQVHILFEKCPYVRQFDETDESLKYRT
jgi:hypothetical protein